MFSACVHSVGCRSASRSNTGTSSPCVRNEPANRDPLAQVRFPAAWIAQCAHQVVLGFGPDPAQVGRSPRRPPRGADAAVVGQASRRQDGVVGRCSICPTSGVTAAAAGCSHQPKSSCTVMSSTASATSRSVSGAGSPASAKSEPGRRRRPGDRRRQSHRHVGRFRIVWVATKACGAPSVSRTIPGTAPGRTVRARCCGRPPGAREFEGRGRRRHERAQRDQITFWRPDQPNAAPCQRRLLPRPGGQPPARPDCSPDVVRCRACSS